MGKYSPAEKIILSLVVMALMYIIFLIINRCGHLFVSKKVLADDGFDHYCRKCKARIRNCKTQAELSECTFDINMLYSKFVPTRTVEEMTIQAGILHGLLKLKEKEIRHAK